MRILILLSILVLFFESCNYSTKQDPQNHIIAFYNLENLFDTINSPDVNDSEYTPEGFRAWNTSKYVSKQNNIAQVLSNLGKDVGIDGPSIIGLCEMENQSVLNDLVNTDSLKKHNYSIVHFDSPDGRGIDVALLYNPEVFTVENTKLYPLIISKSESDERLFTRDQLLVSGKLEGELIHFIINHWPSRYGGQERSIPGRKSAAKLNRQIIDSLSVINPAAKIITMGDLNDNPIDESIKIDLDAHADKDNLEPGDLYNPLGINFDQGKGTLYYRGNWNLFDQMVISQGLLNADSGIQYDSTYIFNKPYLIQQTGNYKGHLLRTFGGKTYLNGYSDHLPVYMQLSVN